MRIDIVKKNSAAMKTTWKKMICVLLAVISVISVMMMPASVSAASTPTVKYRSHVQKIGWQGYRTNGSMSGTQGRSLRMEAIQVSLTGNSYGGGIEYRTHVQKLGWTSWKRNGAMSGTRGRSLRLEAMQVRLTGNISYYYDVYYRVYAQKYGWLGWAKNGQNAGTSGGSLRLEAYQIKLVRKGYSAPGKTSNPYLRIYYDFYQNCGDGYGAVNKIPSYAKAVGAKAVSSMTASYAGGGVEFAVNKNPSSRGSIYWSLYNKSNQRVGCYGILIGTTRSAADQALRARGYQYIGTDIGAYVYQMGKNRFWFMTDGNGKVKSFYCQYSVS